MIHPIWILRCTLLVMALCLCVAVQVMYRQLRTLKKAVDAADETATIQTLRTIVSAQAQAKAIRSSMLNFIIDTFVRCALF